MINTDVQVTITGQYTRFTQASDLTVAIVPYSECSPTSNIPATNYNVVNDLTMIADFFIPDNAHDGYHNLVVNSQLDGYLYKSVSITGSKITTVSPSVAGAGETLTITIEGIYTHFQQATANSVYLYKSYSSYIYSQSVNVLNDNQLQATFIIPSVIQSSSSWSIRVANNIDGTLCNSFSIEGQEIVAVSPDTLIKGESVQVTITGQYTHFTQASSTEVSLYGFPTSSTTVYASNVIAVNDLTLSGTVTIPSNWGTVSSGTSDLHVYNQIDGHLYKYDIFYVTTGCLTGISPSEAETGQPVQVTITALGTEFTQASGTTVYLSYSSSTIQASSIEIINDTKLQANFNIPETAYTGYWDVCVQESIDGLLCKYDALYLYEVVPDIVSVSPDNADAGETIQVIITCSNTHFSQASSISIVLFNEDDTPGFITGLNLQVINDTLLDVTFSIPASWDIPAYCGIYISTDIEEVYEDYIFMVNPPLILNTSESNGIPGDTISMFIECQNTHFAEASEIYCALQFNDGLKETTLITVTDITVLTNTLLSISFIIPADAKLGYWDILLYNDIDGTIIKEKGFAISLTGIEEAGHNFMVSVYPNPACDFLYIIFNGKSSSSIFIDIYDSKGKPVKSEALEYHPDKKFIYRTDIETIEPGLYFLSLHIASENQTRYLKFIILR